MAAFCYGLGIGGLVGLVAGLIIGDDNARRMRPGP